MDLRSAYLDALGIDEWIARDRDAAVVPACQATEAAPSTEPAPRPASAEPPPSGTRAVPDDRDWPALEAAVAGCRSCGLHATRTRAVFGAGHRSAEWFIVGEAPGEEEDLRGEPFVGRAGRLLDAMLRAAGLPREQVFIANVLKSRPPANRDPHADEIAACKPYLLRQIELVQPKLLLAAGRFAAQTLLGSTETIGRLRGRVHRFGPAGIPLVVTYHPAYLLRAPAEKRKAWDDLKLALGTARPAGTARA